jgi:NADPH-dependent 2,4-dienoyl-CoA reductase/sulfur reductase-like enzyme
MTDTLWRSPGEESFEETALIPRTSAQEREYKYLIVGGGMAAAAAFKGIRQVDREGTVGLVGAELDPPYDRTALTKALWKGKPFERIWRLKETDVISLHLGKTVCEVELEGHRVIDDEGGVYGYQKLLLATGGTPRRLPFGSDAVMYLHSLADYRTVRARADEGRRFVVIGGGFIGSEIAAALASNGKNVVMVFPEDGIGRALFPRDLSLFLMEYYGQKGVEVLCGDTVTGVERKGRGVRVVTQSGPAIEADGVVAGLGIKPNSGLAKKAGLKTANGIEVDEHLRTSHPDVHAAGDVASFYCSALERRMRVEHENNALWMGFTAGRNMAGEPGVYDQVPFLYSDLFDLNYEAVGHVDSEFETVADWREPFREGIVYYLHDERVRGVLLWNVKGRTDAARDLVAAPGPFDPDDMEGVIPLP